MPKVSKALIRLLMGLTCTLFFSFQSADPSALIQSLENRLLKSQVSEGLTLLRGGRFFIVKAGKDDGCFFIGNCKLQIEQRQNVGRWIVLYQFQFKPALIYIFELATTSGKRILLTYRETASGLSAYIRSAANLLPAQKHSAPDQSSPESAK